MSNDGASRGTISRQSMFFTVALALGLAIALVGAIAAGGPPRAAAQSAAPTLPAVPDPSLCTVTPRPIGDYHVQTGTPVPTPASVVITAGKPADQATIDGVTATLVEIAACINSGNLRRLDSLGDAAYLGTGEVDQDYYNFLATPHDPSPVNQRYGIFAVSAVQVLADGRVAAIVQFQTNGLGGADLMMFVKQDGRYLIDQWVDGPFDIEPDFGPPATPAAGTPTP